MYIYLAQFFVEIEIFRTKVVEKIKTPTLCSVTFFRKSCLFRIMWTIMLEPDRPQGACALHAVYLRLQTHSDCVIVIDLSRQQWLRERASLLRYTCVAFHVSSH